MNDASDRPEVRVDDQADEIVLRIAFQRRLLRRALGAWWNSTVPRPTFFYRVVFWAVTWGVLLVVTLILAAFGIEPLFAGAAVVGALVFLMGFATLHNLRMRKFVTEIARHWDIAGETDVVFDAKGVVLEDKVSQMMLDWDGIDAIAGARGVTVLRTGIGMIQIPDKSLPEGMKPRAFRKRLQAWKDA